MQTDHPPTKPGEGDDNRERHAGRLAWAGRPHPALLLPRTELLTTRIRHDMGDDDDNNDSKRQTGCEKQGLQINCEAIASIGEYHLVVSKKFSPKEGPNE